MIIDEVKECSKCGLCRSVCPVFLEVNDEVASPRGRISLIEALLEGGLSNSEKYIDTVQACIKCSRCSSVCPVGVKVEDIVQSAREMLAESAGIPDDAKEVFRSLLLDPEKFRASLVDADAGEIPTHSDAGKMSAHPGVTLWQLPLFFHEGVKLPKLADEAVLDKYPEHIKSEGKKRVALFLGCSINYVHTDIADAAIEVLKKLGVDVFLPKDQLCCGAPALLYGDKEAVKKLAERNIAALKADEFDAVVTLCPVCGVVMKHEYEHILDGDMAGFASKIHDISEFIGKFTDLETQPTDMSVTYHDPCYLRLRQEVEAEPRQILSKSAQFIEMKDADKCCGLGCTLGVFHPEISIKMSEAKIEAIVESGADAVATGCPGCIAFLNERLTENGVEKDVLHTVQVLQKSLESQIAKS